MAFVLGLDLSLSSTGISCSEWTRAIRPRKGVIGWLRLREIRNDIVDAAAQTRPDLVVVEGPSFGSIGKGQHERGGLWWMVTEALNAEGIPIAVAPPACIKKYAVGVGAGPKSHKDFVLLAAAKRFEWFTGGNDEADALWAAAMGHDWLGEPLVDMPIEHRKGLDGCAWPARKESAA